MIMKNKLQKILTKIRLPKFVVDVASLFSGRIVMTVLEIAIGILVARILGPEKKGILTTAMVIPVLVISFTDLGLGSTITHMMGKKLFNDQALFSSMTLFILITSVLGIIGAFLAYIITGFQERYGWMIVIISIMIIPARMVMTFVNGVWMAQNRIPRLAIVNIIPDIIYFIGVISLVIFGIFQVELILLSQTLSVIITAVYVLMLVHKYGNLKPQYISELFWKMVKKGMIYALTAFVMGLTYTVDIVILERLTNATEVGVYSAGVAVASLLLWLPSVINTVNFSHSASSSDSTVYARKTAAILRVSLCAALLPVFLLFILAPYVIPLVYGEAYSASVAVVQAILPGIWSVLVFKVLYGDLAGRGRPETALLVFSLAALIDIGLNIWWDPSFGAIGSAWASTISYIIGGIFLGIRYAKLSNLTLRELFIIRRDDIKPLFRLIGKI